MRRSNIVTGALLVCTMLVVITCIAAQQHARVTRVNPTLTVEAIEPVVPFWVALGWEPFDPVEVDGELTFMAFSKDGYSIHYQTLAHIERSIPGAADMLRGATALVYVTVDDVNLVVESLGSNVEIVIPRQNTAWGADEIHVREPGGHLIAFASYGDN